MRSNFSATVRVRMMGLQPLFLSVFKEVKSGKPKADLSKADGHISWKISYQIGSI